MAAPPRRTRARWRRALAAAVLLSVPPAGEARGKGQADPSLEIQVKAEFVERFTRFVEWPPEALPPGGPFVVCTIGGGGLATRLGQVLERGGPGGREVRLVRGPPDGALDACHVLYLAGSERERAGEVLLHVRDRPVLTVGDTPGLAARGLIINLYVDPEGFVRFEINREAAQASGLRLSARLLALARLVPAGE